MHELINWLVETIGALGYAGIFLLMALESSVFPIPSELVMPPAGYLAQQGKMNMGLAILCGTFGSLAGAYANYFVARWLGRPLVIKYGRYVWITEEHFNQVESFFLRHGEISTFIGRLLPVIRHLISIPAGIIRMGFLKFSVMTTVGAAIWCSVLAWLGGKVGRDNPEILKDPEALIHAVKRESIPILVAVAVVCVLYVLAMKLTAPKDAAQPQREAK